MSSQPITEEIQEAELQAMALIVKFSDDAILSNDMKGVILSWNQGAERIYGYTREEIIGQSVKLLFHPNQSEIDPLLKVAQGESVRDLLVERITKDGRSIWLSIAMSPIRDSAGRIIGASTIGRDVTARLAIEKGIVELNETLRKQATSLAAANQELEAFSYSVSHDLRAPLRHLAAFLELLEGRIGGSLDEKSRHYMNVALVSARRMGCLIDDLLRFSQAGRGVMREAPVDLNALVAEAQQELSVGSGQRRVLWTVGPLPIVSGDAGLLRQVVVNLLDNALKYTAPQQQAEIEVGCRAAETEWVVFVRDNGVGFDMQYADKLFSVFQRLHSSSDFTGTGIGLATVQRIVARHGGRTWAEGVVGGGATFYFSLPGAAGADNACLSAGAGG